MKKILVCLLAVLLAAALTACDGIDGPDTSTDTTGSSGTTTEEPEASTTAGEPETSAPEESQTTAEPTTTQSEAPVTTTAPAPVPMDLEKQYEGTWTAEDGKFLCFSEEEGAACLFFGIWNAGGAMPAGEITEVTVKDASSWELTVHHERTEFHDDPDDPEKVTGVSEAYDEAFTLTSADGRLVLSFKGGKHDWNGLYTYYAEHQFPDPEKPFGL